MKRRISIFAFLLCASVVVGPFTGYDALADVEKIRVTPYGIYPPESKPFDKTVVSKYFNPSGDTTVLYRDAPWTISAVNDTPGWGVEYWLGENSQPVHGEYAGTKIDGTEGKTAYVLTADYFSKTTSGVLFLAVKFRHISYNLAYDSAGGTPTPSGGTYKYDERFNLAEAPTRTGYTFGGWRATPVGSVFTAGETVSGTNLCPATWHEDGSNVTMIAQWTPHTYTVACDLGNGAWPTGYAPPAEASFDQIFSLPTPTRLGYDFQGWKVTAGLDSSTARWGMDGKPTSTIYADTLCVNGDKEVYFKNLNPTNDVDVALTAQWQPKTIKVTFNNTGGSSGGGLLDTLNVEYDAAYPALNTPSKGGNLFRGYEIGEIQYWDMAGQPAKAVWDIPSNCTAVARWEALAYQLTYNENRSDGKTSKEVVRGFEYGVPTTLYDGTGFSNLGCTLLGWSTNRNAEKPDDGCEIGGQKAFTESKTLYAVWEKNYFIAYDGNGATNETPMTVQKFVFGKENQSLDPNAYGKVGYSFLGWATNRVAAQRLDWTYEDRQILRNDLAKTLGETNMLYATWGTNTYFIAFNPNGGIGAAMPVKTCTYDQPVTLPAATYIRDIHDFVGWSNDVAKVVYTNLSESVSNLCSVANGTNMLYAVWKSALSDLAIAMGCDNLNWTDSAGKWFATTDEWTDGSTISCACVTNAGDAYMNSSAITTNGVLHFWWKATGAELDLQYLFNATYRSERLDDEYSYGVWNETNIVVSLTDLKTDSAILSFFHWKNSTCWIAKLTWTPGGAEHPEPTDTDKVTISSAAVSDGKFVLSFDSDERFDYNLLTNANLLINSWGVMTNEVGTGKPITFEPEIIEGQPQLFYRVDTIQKK